MKVSREELAKHNKRNSCWISIKGKVYDVTKFMMTHPGGATVIMKVAGKDSTAEFNVVHNDDILKLLKPSLCIGELTDFDGSKVTDPSVIRKDKAAKLPPLTSMINVFDFEGAAAQVMSVEGWAYFSSGAEDELTLRENHAAFHRLWLRPRVLRDVSVINTSTKLLGALSTMPLYVTSTALGKMADPEGEAAITRACGRAGITYMCPTMASCTMEEMMEARVESQTLWFQLYVNSDRKLTLDLIRRAETGGAKALFITVDAPGFGLRTKDMRHKAPQLADVQNDDPSVDRSQGTAQALTSFIDPSLSWGDLKWIREATALPLCLKGIQTAEDACIAARIGIKAIVLSNHGGRQLDTARSGVEILYEVKEGLRDAGLDQTGMEIYVDGGIRRGSDIFKCLALGANGVGIGRPIIYALAAYGPAGVERCLEILQKELVVCMQMMGCKNIEDIVPSMISSGSLRSLRAHSSPPVDFLSNSTYHPLLASKL